MRRLTSSCALASLALLAACGKGEAEPLPVAPAPLASAAPAATSPTPDNAPAAPSAAALAPAGAPAPETARVGAPAPDFTLPDLDGKPVTLATFRGKTVVLEWYNPDCPFVVKQHKEGPLKDMASKAVADGVVWLAVNSGAPGKQGHGLERNKASLSEYGLQHPVLLDEDGTVGKRYVARNTPHMYVIDPAGTLVYAGAIDNAPLGKVPDDGLVNHVAEALVDLAASRPVRVPETRAYGCSVKYAD